MLDIDTRRRIDTARDILVGKLPDPKSQVEQITIALIYKFMDDMDREALELGGKAKFFTGEYQQYAWSKIFDPRLSGYELVSVYGEAVQKMNQNPNIPQLFRDIFKNAFLPYRDPETLKSFLKIINDFEYEHSEKLGDAFEYLLSVLGSQGEAGQFRTPRHIIDFMVEIVDPKKNENILDPACGTAGFLISSYKHILKYNSENFDPEKDPRAFELHGVRLEEITINSKKYLGDKLTSDDRERLVKNIIGYDISPDMVRLSLVNMYLHGFSNPRIFEYDTLTSEEKWNENADVIMANPPFMSPKGGIRPHKRFSIESSRSEVLFVDYIVEHLTPQGRAAVIVPEGIIFQAQMAHKNLRKMLIEKNYLVGVISLPSGEFNPYSGVKTSILWMDKTLAKKTDKILFVKIENDGFDLGAPRRPIKQNDLPNAFRTINEYKKSLDARKDFDAAKFQNTLIIQRSKIAENNDYNLTGERYKPILDMANLKWPIVKLSEICEYFDDGDWVESKDQSETGIRLIQTGNVGLGEYFDKYDKARFITEDIFTKLRCKEVFPGDILFSRLPDPVGRSCMVPNLGTRMITAVDCTIARVNRNRIVPLFLMYMTNSDEYFRNISRFLTGSSRSRISRTNLEKVGIPLPPLDVQEQIVAEISGYQKIIDGARQVIDNYRPQIQVDPEWPQKTVGETCTLITGGTPTSTIKEYYENGDIKWLVSGDIHKGEIFNCENRITKKGLENSNARWLPVNSVLIALNGQGKTRGTVALLRTEATCNQSIVAVNPNNHRELMPEFLYYQLKARYQEIRTLTGDNQRSGLNMPIIRNISIAVPLLEIQSHIVTQLEKEQEIVNSNQQLVEIFEQKTKDRIAHVWGEM